MVLTLGYYYGYVIPTGGRCDFDCRNGQLNTYGNPDTGVCSSVCANPYPYYFTSSHITYNTISGYAPACVKTCTPNYKDNPLVSYICVIATGCSGGYFSDPNTMSCVQTCPNISATIYYGRSDMTCKTECHSDSLKTITNNQSNLCVDACPTASNLYYNP